MSSKQSTNSLSSRATLGPTEAIHWHSLLVNFHQLFCSQSAKDYFLQPPHSKTCVCTRKARIKARTDTHKCISCHISPGDRLFNLYAQLFDTCSKIYGGEQFQSRLRHAQKTLNSTIIKYLHMRMLIISFLKKHWEWVMHLKNLMRLLNLDLFTRLMLRLQLTWNCM